MSYRVTVNDNEREEYPDVPYQAVVTDENESLIMIGVGATPEQAVISAFEEMDIQNAVTATQEPWEEAECNCTNPYCQV